MHRMPHTAKYIPRPALYSLVIAPAVIAVAPSVPAGAKLAANPIVGCTIIPYAIQKPPIRRSASIRLHSLGGHHDITNSHRKCQIRRMGKCSRSTIPLCLQDTDRYLRMHRKTGSSVASEQLHNTQQSSMNVYIHRAWLHRTPQLRLRS